MQRKFIKFSRLIPVVSIYVVASACFAFFGTKVASAEERPLGRKKIGVVLEGGGAKGFAHVGVLKVLEQEHIPVDIIVGTSMGSIVGAAYASGRTIDEMEEVLSSTDWDELFVESAHRREVTYRNKAGRDRELYGDTKIGFKDGGVVLPTALVQGQNIEPVLQRLLGKVPPSISFDDLPVRYRAVAADIETGEAVVLSKGNLALATRASMSVPTFFAPVEIDGRLLVDGGITDNLPVQLARSMGADIIIAVECKDHLRKREKLENALSITSQILDMLLEKNTQESLKHLGPDDVHIPVEMGEYSSTSFANAKEIMALGEKSANEAKARLQKLGVGEQQFLAFYEHRVGGESYKPVIDYVRVTEVDDAKAEELKKLFKSELEKPFDVAAIQQKVAEIHQSGEYKKVTYEFEEKDGKTGLVVKASPKDWLENYARLGFALEDNFDGESNYSLALQTRLNQLNAWGAYLDLQLEAGRSPRVFAEIYQPLGKGSSFFLAPEVSWNRQELLIRDDNHVIAEFQRDVISGAMKGGYSLGKYGELSTGWKYGEGRVNRLIGDPELQDRNYDVGEVFERIAIDQLDNPDFPTEGYRMVAQGTHARDGLGTDDPFDKYEGIVSVPLTLGANTLLIAGEAGGASSDLPIERYSSFGGFLDISGFEQGSLLASQYWISRAAYYRRIAEGGSSLFPFGGYLGGTFEFASLRSDIEDFPDRPHLAAGSVFVGADTPLLPIYFGFGLAEEGETSAYMNIGRIAGRRR